ncbi:MAG: helix-turn-helix domain-containing protein [Ruminococcus sp.]
MKFNKKLNEYIEILDCTAKELSQCSGISTATISRYRSGERVPEANSEQFNKICTAVALLSEKKLTDGEYLTETAVAESFLKCADIIASDKEQFRQKLNTLISALNINIKQLCRSTNYEMSGLFRIRNGSRKPSDPMKFASDIARFIVREMNSPSNIEILAKLFGCSDDDISDTEHLFTYIRDWLLSGQVRQTDSVEKFLATLNEFNLNEYIKAIHFDQLKVPSVPFQLPTSKTYFGLKDMMTSELDFLKATVLSKSMEPVIMYSDMPMEEMSKDSEFPKKWMFGMAMMLKKGLHLNQIHNIDRPFNEMMLGLESWIPMYMTGQVSPYYLEDVQNTAFLHFLKVSGTAALSGEAIAGYHSDGKYYLTKSKEEVAYYKKRAQELLGNARPLMDIYREENEDKLNAFLLADSYTEGKRRGILSAPPVYTMNTDYLNNFLRNHNLSEDDRQKILDYANTQRKIAEEILKSEIIKEEIPIMTKEEFERYPSVLSLSGMFFEKDIPYTYDEYLTHIKQTAEYERTHPNYRFRKTSTSTFRNLQIIIHEGKWAMVSKGKSPAIHFVIHHPKLRMAIEEFTPPMVEEQYPLD